MIKSTVKLTLFLLAFPLFLFAENKDNVSLNIENQCFENPPPYTISGYVTKEDGTPLEGAILHINGVNYYTDENGFYSTPMFDEPVGLFSPFIFDDWQRGVDTVDVMLLIQYFYDSVQLSPYKLLAGDFNNSQGISTFDLVLLTKLILGIEIPSSNAPWRFILADYVFSNPTYPWGEPFPEVISINELPENNLEINWIAYKMGDIDCSAGPNVSNGIVQGKVFLDEDGNCMLNEAEGGLSGWAVALDDGESLTYTTTNNAGNYSFFTLAGDYEITVFPPYEVWTPCLPNYAVTVQIGETSTLDLGIEIVKNCPILEIEIATYGLIPCEEGTYVVNYKNVGTASAENTILEITFDGFLTVTESELPWTSVDGNTYSFDVGTMAIGDFENFSIKTAVGCDAILGQTHCVAAYISPDDFCASPADEWDGSSIELHAWCSGDSIHFEIINTGESMEFPTGFEIVEDDLVMTTDELQLLAGETQTITIFANGATFRLKVDQSFAHPGISFPTIAIEACGENEDGEVSLGYVTLFPEDDGNPFLSIHCIENTAALIPNSKNVFSKGVYEEHFIEANTEIEYMIHFQNTTEQSISEVMIKDSVFTHLDPGSIRLGPSSHHYNFMLTGAGVVNFIFDNINLPSSSMDEAASHGFVTFYIQQKSNLPLGTQIVNKAEIYFSDAFNTQITNTTLNTIGEDFLEDIVDGTQVPSAKTPRITVFPLPANDFFFVEIKRGAQILKSGQIQIFSLEGKQMSQQKITSNKELINCKHFPKGIYWVKVLLDEEVILCEKIVVQ